MQRREFVCEGYGFDQSSGVLSLRYAFDGGPQFEERITFPVERALGEAERAALDRVFRLLLLACGVSYYKAFAPARVRCAAFELDRAKAAFFRDFYIKGLAEFAWRNRIDLSDLSIEGAGEAMPAIELSLPRRACVPIGGGKDSTVAVECLRAAGEDVVLFALGNAQPIEDTMRVAGLPALRVTRRLDPALFDLNAAGVLNGHVPITGILSMIVLACAVICGFDAIMMSNEHSASAPNVADVNHQWSKSFDFEQAFAEHVERHVVRGVRYFSLLRPLTEVAIARRFARLEQYFPVFRSCNTAFRQDVARRPGNWCCDCPKCRFVFLALAPFLAKARLVAIFGRDMLDDAAQIDGFGELCGVVGHKPFECVGEVEESAAVMRHLASMEEWRDDAVVRVVAPRVEGSGFEALFLPRGPHRVPDRYMAMLDACG
jgi:UDP-N-acetyl-alpha-D-muramoyl-L-alanyl-L-glutamate epimerase